MTDSSPAQRDVGGIVISVILIAMGGLVLYDTTTYGDVDSAAFPRAVAIAMILVSALVLLRALLFPVRDPDLVQPSSGSWARRIALIAFMLGSALLMAVVGFLAAMAIMFAGVLVVANYDNWTLRRVVIYAISGAAVVSGFYAIFRYWLMVPLP